MELACLDLEGVLIPEIWINVAERTGIEALRLTTRDIPDYDELMRGRLALLDQHGLKLSDIQRVIAGMGPMEGAREFLDWLRATTDLDWTFLSPSALFIAGERTGKFRLGRDQLLRTAAGSSISFEDFAVALVNELEQPEHIRQRFTVGY